MSFAQQPTLRGDTWLLTDGRAGNVRQAAALARALGRPAAAPTLVPRAPWRWVAPRRLPGAAHAYGEAFSAALAAVHADQRMLAIGCGRQGALASRLLRQRGARAVQILDPRLDPRHWDLVVAPEHDGLRGDNVIRMLGSLNPVDDAWLAEAAARFPTLLALPRPRIVLLVGGPTRHAPWTGASLGASLDLLRQRVLAQGGSLLATVSRRTPAPVRDLLRQQLHDLPGLLWEGAGDNPYPGLLACADRLLCTPDSVNMLSEACATAAPVQVLDPDCARGRIAAFLRALQARGRLQDADGGTAAGTVVPLRETARVAAQVRERLELDRLPG